MADSRVLHPCRPVDLVRTLLPLQMGAADPTMQVGRGHAVRALRTPAGPATVSLRTRGREIVAEAWGAGAAWILDHAPGYVGRHDDLSGFAPDGHPAVARAHRRRPGLRIARTGLVVDTLVPTILAQKVTGTEAKRAWSGIVRSWGEPAPGPTGLLLAPRPDALAARPYWAYHRFGVERTRAETIRRACARIGRLEEAVGMERMAAWRRLTALPGLGHWTAAILMRHAMGDPDTVEAGDYHLKNTVGWNLAGEPRANDERMLELLEPFAGHRGRVVLLLESAGQRAPRYGPRRALGPIARL